MSFDDDVCDRGSAPPEIPTTLASFQRAFDRIAAVLVEGEKKHRGAWRQQSVATHADHLVAHVVDGSDLLARGRRDTALEELAHAATRSVMLLERALAEDESRDGGNAT